VRRGATLPAVRFHFSRIGEVLRVVEIASAFSASEPNGILARAPLAGGPIGDGIRERLAARRWLGWRRGRRAIEVATRSAARIT
jgi:hypothetical protein